MHPSLPALCSRKPSPLFMLTPTGAGASHARNANRSGCLLGHKHHDQRSGLKNWPKSDVGIIIISHLSYLASNSVLLQAQDILNPPSLENPGGWVSDERTRGSLQGCLTSSRTLQNSESKFHCNP